MAAVVSFVTGLQALKRFGWSRWRSLPWWGSILVSVLAAYFVYRWSGYVRIDAAVAAIILGLFVGTVMLVRMKPRWSSSP